MPRPLLAALAVLALIAAARVAPAAEPARAPDPTDAPELVRAVSRHLDLLLGADGTARALKGKTADGQTAFAAYVLFESTDRPAYRTAATGLADRVLRDMRATRHGVLAIKEKDKAGGETILGGGPPALGFLTTRVAYVLHREGGREADLAYLAGVIDRYPWNEHGWWAATIDVNTGEPKEPLTKPSIINKSAALALAAGVLSQYVRASAPELSARLRHKADRCLYEQILPAQTPDGFWHYSLTGNDPKEKDVYGYFMLTANVLLDLQLLVPAYRTERLTAALQKARDFARRNLSPLTDPRSSPSGREYATPGTPARYTLPADAKRSFALARLLIATGETNDGRRVLGEALRHFPFGNGGQDGAHAVDPTAFLVLASRP